MSHYLQTYHKTKRRVRQLHPEKRITRVRNLALLITGLCLGEGIHLAQIISAWPLPGKDPSLVNRLRRFLANAAVEVQSWYRPVVQQFLAPFAGHRLRLIIDSTEIGGKYRLLMVGLAYRKRTLPLLWSVHVGSQGHTDVHAQRALFTKVAQWLPRDAEVWVLGDTEFQSVPLLCWFAKRHWHFVIRQQGRIKIYRQGHGWQKLNTLALAEGETRAIGWVRLTEKHDVGWFWLLLHWEAGEDDPWYLVSDCAGPRKLLRLYKVRMWIEEMFGDLKDHGFHLQATGLRDPARLSRLVLGVCITFVWFLTLGAWVVKRGFRHLIDRKDRRDKSYFRLGQDWINRCRRLAQPFKVHFRPYL